MVSKEFFTGSKYLVEDSDGRVKYFRYNGEQFLKSLAMAGQKVVDAPFDAEEEKQNYLKMLVKRNEEYFDSRQYEEEAAGKYLKHDDNSERRLRVKTAEKFTEQVDDLRHIFAVHDAIMEAAVENIKQSRSGAERVEALKKARPTLLGCTNMVVSDAWFQAVKAYHYSLSPGELVAEDRDRRHRRIEGTEETPGIKELLAKPYFRRLDENDLQRIRNINRKSPGQDTKIWKRLLDKYQWFIGYDHGKTVVYSEDDAPEDAETSAAENGNAGTAENGNAG